ncbi:(R)-amidase [Parvibaculum indicum]|uniref:carbon-nitrogen hydrolase family protein n=1 Tax=Parvibaculum indicum TaxID=562969 RepID=UPI00141E433D|nr:carbon-nitrogen hydrolase family protein [Parvibaculum indicum]NIJ42504.1 (R)-amidase [Parvibaculum indicum]
MSKLKIALGQMRIDDGNAPDNLPHNLKRIEAIIEEAGPGHDLIVLPETATSGFADRASVAAVAEPLTGPTVERLTGLAARHACVIAIGLAELSGEDFFNTAAIIGPGGLLMAYRKTHLWRDDLAIFRPGSEVAVADIGGYRLGALICYDVEFPEPARLAAAQGADLIALSNGNMNPYGDVHRRAIAARAQENQLFVAVANRVGDGKDMTFAGGSMVAGPDGSTLLEMGTEEAIGSLEIDLDQVSLARRDYCYLDERRFRIEGDAKP